ncbi:MAG: hypothetical protein SPL13_00255, partial [Clostridia bacterium]|nr:hypothetical protein [Clostridia bacterium]
LVAMKKAFGVEDDITAVANLLGSDSGYMSGEGPAIISGRGDNITNILPIPTLFLLLITEKEKCFSGEVYKKFDIEGNSFPPCTKVALEFLEKGDLTSFVKTIKNDLTESACSFVPEIRENINALLNAGADAALMTGSGSCSYGIFFTAAARNKAYKNLFPIYKERLIKTKTI